MKSHTDERGQVAASVIALLGTIGGFYLWWSKKHGKNLPIKVQQYSKV